MNKITIIVHTESIPFSDYGEANHHVAKACPVSCQENYVQTATTLPIMHCTFL